MRLVQFGVWNREAGPDFAEDAWVGRVLRIGGLRMRVDLRDQRCVMVTIDPVTLHRDPAILRAIARERDNRLGVYGSAVERAGISVLVVTVFSIGVAATA